MAKELIFPKSVKNASSLKNEKSCFLAGGTEINRLDSSVKADSLIALGRLVELDGIYKVEIEDFCDDFIRIGAMSTFQEIIDSELIPDYLKQACMFMSSRVKREMATIGGNIACLRDDSYLIPTLLCAKAKLLLRSHSGKSSYVCMCKYVEEHEKYRDFLIEEVLLHDIDIDVKSKRFANTASSHAYLTVSVASFKDDTLVSACVKNSGIYYFKNSQDYSSVKFPTDQYGSKNYKKYLFDVTVDDLLKELGGEK